MKRNQSINDRFKKIITPIIRRKIIKVNREEDVNVELKKLSRDEKLDLMEMLQDLINEEARKQFRKIQKAKAAMKNIRPVKLDL